MARKSIMTEAHLRSIDSNGEMTSAIQGFVDDLNAGRCEPISDPVSLIRHLSAFSSTLAQLVSAVAYRMEFDRQRAELDALRAKVDA